MSTVTEDKALSLLGSGVPQEAVASALGVTPSYISQLLSDEGFAGKVTELKYELLSKHSARDSSYDDLEDTLVARLKKNVALLIKPQDILKAIQVINGAKRRGTDTAENIVNQQNIVQLTLPTQIVQQFTTNINNQVIKTGDQELRTIQSGDLRSSVDLPPPALEAPVGLIPEDIDNPDNNPELAALL